MQRHNSHPTTDLPVKMAEVPTITRDQEIRTGRSCRGQNWCIVFWQAAPFCPSDEGWASFRDAYHLYQESLKNCCG